MVGKVIRVRLWKVWLLGLCWVLDRRFLNRRNLVKVGILSFFW